MSPSMKIAIYQPRASYYIGGGEVVALEHARHLALRGHSVTLLTTRALFIEQSTLFQEFRNDNPNVRVRYVEVPDALKWIYDREPGVDWDRWHNESFHVGRLAQDWFRSRRFDIIALHNVVDGVAVPVGRKSVIHLHGFPDRLEDLQRVCLLIPNVHVAVSKYIKERWLDFGTLKSCAVAHNGIDPDRFQPVRGHQEEYDVLYAGRLVPIKGVEYLLKAVATLKSGGAAVRTAVVGDGPDRRRLEKLARTLGIGDDVNFLGRVSDNDLKRLYLSSRMTVLPSYDREGVLTTMLEAASCGKPVVTTTAASMKEFLGDGRNGFLVEPRDAMGLAKAIKRLITNENLRVRLGRQARRDVVSKWKWENRIIPVEKLYERTVNSN